MHVELAVEVDNQGVTLDLHGVDLQLVELEVVASSLAGGGQELAQ